MNRILLAATLLASTAVAGCRTHRDIRVAFEMSPLANNDTPISVDLVQVRDLEQLHPLTMLSASEWFAKRGEIRQMHSEAFDLSTWSWELVPGQTMPSQTVSVRGDGYYCLIFANYSSPGVHRINLRPCRSFSLQLGPSEAAITFHD